MIRYTRPELIESYTDKDVRLDVYRLFREDTETGRFHPLFNFVLLRDTGNTDDDGEPILSRRLYKKNLASARNVLLDAEEGWENILEEGKALAEELAENDGQS